MTPSLTERCAEFITALRYEDLPSHVLERTQALFLHGLSVGLLCYPLEPSRIAREVTAAAEPLANGARILVDGTRVTVGGAIFANAAMLQARNNEDTYNTVTHIGCAVIPVALAVGETVGASGREILTAVAAGYEMTARCAGEFYTRSTPSGFRGTALYNTVGAAATAGRLLGLDRAHLADALGIAATYSGGLLQGLGEAKSDWKFQAGHTARTGYLAATLAAAGATGPSQALEGPAGFYRAFCGLDRVPDVAAGLGQRWDFVHTISKLFPVATINQTPVRATLKLRREHDLRPEEIERIAVEMAEFETRYPGALWRGPFTPGVQPPSSIVFAVASAMARGNATWATQCATDDPTMLALLDRVAAHGSAARSAMTCALAVTTKDGRRLTEVADEGPAYYQFDWERAVAAVRELQAETPLDLERLIAGVRRLEDSPGVYEVLDACMAP